MLLKFKIRSDDNKKSSLQLRKTKVIYTNKFVFIV